jgi:hypothetical protein
MVRLLPILKVVRGQVVHRPLHKYTWEKAVLRETRRYHKGTAVNTSFLIDKNILALVLFESTGYSRYVSILVH